MVVVGAIGAADGGFADADRAKECLGGGCWDVVDGADGDASGEDEVVAGVPVADHSRAYCCDAVVVVVA